MISVSKRMNTSVTLSRHGSGTRLSYAVLVFNIFFNGMLSEILNLHYIVILGNWVKQEWVYVTLYRDKRYTDTLSLLIWFTFLKPFQIFKRSQLAFCPTNHACFEFMTDIKNVKIKFQTQCFVPKSKISSGFSETRKRDLWKSFILKSVAGHM